MTRARQPHHKLYRELAWLWPVFSPPGDYRDEALGLHRQITRHRPRRKAADRPTLLELGSGGGHMLHHLREHYDITAIDLSPAMLRLSRKLNPGILHKQGDMRTLRLNRTFDVVLIHDALGYLLTLADLKRAIRTATLHLSPAGLLALLPDETRETLTQEQAATDTVQTPDGRQVTLISHARPVGRSRRQYELTMQFLIAHQGKLRVEVDSHRCGLFGEEQWRTAIENAKLELLAQQRRPRWRGSPFMLARKPGG